jgi:hypothetical protein
VLLLKETLEEWLFSFQVKLCFWSYLDSIRFYNKVDYLVVLFRENSFTDLSQLDLKLVWLPLVVLALVNLFILHKHESDRQVQDKEWANPNADYEKWVHENPIVNVLVNVHYSSPAVHSCANKDGQKGRERPIKVGYSVVEIFLVGINPQVGIIKWIAGSIFIELFESW